jgi:CRISPR-associated protein Cmr1
MPKEIPACPTKPEAARDAEHSFDVALITPMFGGGVKPRENDTACPIRATSIRGQLQFWWRATRGAGCQTVDALRAAQTEIWGSTERASRVQVLVDQVKADAPLPCARFQWNPKAGHGRGRWQTNWQAPFDRGDSALPYALFPFQGKTPPPRRDAITEVEPASCIRRATFRLIVRCPPELWADVEPSIWAWVNFGGIGARTRRGCGSLFCERFAPKDVSQIRTWLNTAGPLIGEVRDWPTLPASVLIRPIPGDPVPVWDWVIGLFKHFRQGEGFARNPGQGRSRYPEPETIRRITGRRWDKHEPWDNMPDGFPRAELGLPIVFHFKDEDRGEPLQTLLNPYVNGEALERMASPLILKPLALASQQAVPLILRLATPGVQHVELQDDGRNCLTPRHAVPVQDPSFAQTGLPLHGLSASGSALEAFVNFARGRTGFEEYNR